MNRTQLSWCAAHSVVDHGNETCVELDCGASIREGWQTKGKARCASPPLDPGHCAARNVAVLKELKQAGVDLRVCGQGLLGKKVDPKDVLPDVQVDLWAMTTMVNLQLRGYVRIGG